MTQVVLNIEDDKFKTFMEFIKTLNYVSISKGDEIPSWQMEEVDKRLKLIKSGKMSTRSWNEAKSDIFKK